MGGRLHVYLDWRRVAVRGGGRRSVQPAGRGVVDAAGVTAQLVLDALTMALWRRGKPAQLLHHSDQGSQYTSEDFQRLLSAEGITCSMSRRGDCWDNSAVESFFASLKKERVYRKTYATRDAARADIFDYIEAFYNSRRRHSALGQVSPNEFERTCAGLA